MAPGCPGSPGGPGTASQSPEQKQHQNTLFRTTPPRSSVRRNDLQSCHLTFYFMVFPDRCPAWVVVQSIALWWLIKFSRTTNGERETVKKIIKYHALSSTNMGAKHNRDNLKESVYVDVLIPAIPVTSICPPSPLGMDRQSPFKGKWEGESGRGREREDDRERHSGKELLKRRSIISNKLYHGWFDGCS